MRITDHTDYSIRVLMHLNKRKKLLTLQELSEDLGITKNNLIKVSNQLVKAGFVDSVKGRFGGLKISDKAGERTLREIICETEESFNIVTCFKLQECDCVFYNNCKFKKVLDEALESFLSVLGKKTLNDVTV